MDAKMIQDLFFSSKTPRASAAKMNDGKCKYSGAAVMARGYGK